MTYIAFIAIRLFISIFRIIPFSFIYPISNLLAWLLQNIFRYRSDVIRINLQHCFPTLKAEGIRDIEKMYYRHVADLILESLKAFHITQSELIRRFQAKNLEVVDSFFSQGKSILIVTSHIGNWEWGATIIGHYLKHRALGVYKPLTNPYMDTYTKRSRGKFGTELVSMKEVRDYIKDSEKDPYALILVSDQSPSNMDKAIWVNLFNQPTPFAHGLDDISRENKLPVLYVDIQRIRRGFYEMEFEILNVHPENGKRGEITERYARKLETLVTKNVTDWLWSHKRWKKIKPNIYLNQK